MGNILKIEEFQIDRIDRVCKLEFLKKAGFIYTAVMKYVDKMEKKESS